VAHYAFQSLQQLRYALETVTVLEQPVPVRLIEALHERVEAHQRSGSLAQGVQEQMAPGPALLKLAQPAQRVQAQLEQEQPVQVRHSVVPQLLAASWRPASQRQSAQLQWHSPSAVSKHTPVLMCKLAPACMWVQRVQAQAQGSAVEENRTLGKTALRRPREALLEPAHAL
jgi:hypothetical protein